MEAYVVKGTDSSLEKRDIPVPGPNEALVRVLTTGICNTDLEILKGYMGFSGVLGHEFVGVCEEVQNNEHGHFVGKRVVGDINLACTSSGSNCQTCKAGGDRARNHCPSRTVLGILNKDGTYAHYLTLPVDNLHLVPDSVSTSNAAFTEPLAAACRILEQNLVQRGDKVCVVGDGKLGLLCAMVLGTHMEKDGSKAFLLGRHKEKMELAVGAVGDCVVPVMADDALASHAGTFDVVVDATGSPQGLDLSRQLCRTMGTLVLKSTCAAGSDFNTAPFVIDELRIVGSRCGPFDKALDMLADGLDLTPMITATYPFSDVVEALDKARTKGTVKVQLIMSTKE